MKINPMDILKNALQEQMGDLQEKMESVVVTGSAGGGMVEIDLNGRMEVSAVRLAPEIVNPDDIGMLQDLIQFAFTDAAEKVRGAVSSQMGQLVSAMSGNFSGGNAP
ncbi:MAG: YbaB/EbfC family nucleoid-associated protein [Spirochaetaceae bacterium]|nr:YbaB/EbfC family nucleoid-associated protein [Spirochaetaceae bacterium]